MTQAECDSPLQGWSLLSRTFGPQDSCFQNPRPDLGSLAYRVKSKVQCLWDTHGPVPDKLSSLGCHTHAHTHTRAHIHARACMHMHAHAHACTHSHTCAHTHPCTPAALGCVFSLTWLTTHGKVSMWRFTLPSLPRRASPSALPGSLAPR